MSPHGGDRSVDASGPQPTGRGTPLEECAREREERAASRSLWLPPCR